MHCIVFALLAVLLSHATSGAHGAARPIPLKGTAVAAAGLNPTCPEGCADGYCYSDSTGGTAGYKCQKCVNNLYVRKSDGQCGCIPGRYSPGGRATCADCPVGTYCVGGVYTAADYPRSVQCPGNMTTRGVRGTNDRSCVNLPGFYFSLVNDSAVAVLCPVDTYGAGMRKQRACVPCPPGYSTMGKVGQYVPQACVLPPGYYLKGPGQVAACPQGEFKTGTKADANCIKCAVGVTTPGIASTSAASCNVLQQGWYASNITGGIIMAAQPCPQGFYCPGGPAQSAFDPTNPSALSPAEPSIKACPAGMWTVDVASMSLEQCLTPPGFKTVNGTTVQCEAGSYRDGWAPLGKATSCTPCGTGVFAEKTDRVTQYDLVTYMPTQIAVTTSSDDCYIHAGQGLYYEAISQTWRARNCISNSYGVNKITYSLTASPCRSCPQNMVTSTNATAFPNSAAWFVNNTDGLGGFTGVQACVNQAGYGYNGRVSQLCDRGYYNGQDTYGTCTPCGYGLTTAGVGAGKSAADCGVALGYGWNGAAVMPCDMGTYNNASYTASSKATCTACPTGTTTGNTGADDIALCNLCQGGWGGTNCQTRCGGKGTEATYGDNGRPFGADCMLCTWSSTGFSFQWQGQNDLFSAQAVSPIGADSSWDCVSEFAQLVDGAWYVPTSGNTAMNVTANISTFADCVALCTAPSCEYVTYDYRGQICYIRIAYDPVFMGAPLIAFKAIPSGDVATNAFSVKSASVSMGRHRHGAPSSCCGGASSSTASNSSSLGSNDVQPAAAMQLGGGAVKAASEVKGSSVSSGQYSFYIEPNADSVGYQSPAPGRNTFALGFAGLQQCLNACDDQTWCVGVVMQLFVDIPTSPRSCNLIRGDTSPGRFLRSVVRADVDRLRVPSIFT